VRLCLEMGKICDGGKMDVTLCIISFAWAARTAITTVAAIWTITAFWAIILAHHNRWALFMGINADGHIANDVFIQPCLTFQFGNNIAAGIDIKHDKMRFAILLDFIGQRAQTPGFGLDDLAFIIFNDFCSAFGKCVNLGLREVLTRQKHMLIQSHGRIPYLTDR
jgi:hypothetical protein